MSTEFDIVIVGQGLAGTALAWQLRWLGQRVAIIDREPPVTSSRIAAGLISPLTGRRRAVSWRFLEIWKHAKSFYERVQQETDTKFFDQRPLVWLLDDEFRKALTSDPAKASFVRQCSEPPDDHTVDSSLNAVELTPSARLDVKSYLDISRRVFRSDGSYHAGSVSEADVSLNGEQGVALPRFNVMARKLIFCQGIDAEATRWFPELVFERAKGEILTLRIPGFTEQRVLRHDVWLAPVGHETFLAGATFDRNALDAQPTEQGRAEVLGKLAAFLRQTPKVIDHNAAFRPIVRGRLPVVGLDRSDPRLGCFNGLGSKGALRAPFAAWQFAELLVSGKQVIPEIQLPGANAKQENPSPRRLTELAHQYVIAALGEGDVAIDATAGNGLDTVFLAQRVGQGGCVFAIDRQQDAIDRTHARLEAEGLTNVRLICDTHAGLSELIPVRYHGEVTVVMLNLGYLPRGDKSITTSSDSTRGAIQSGLELLRAGGIMTVLAYTGHPGGLEEAGAVEQLLTKLPPCDFESQIPTGSLEPGPPRLYVISKR